jgi:lysophospholipase L1-like esterase
MPCLSHTILARSLLTWPWDRIDAKWVWLTIGGNDAKNELPLGVPVEILTQELVNRTKTFLDPMVRTLHTSLDVALD